MKQTSCGMKRKEFRIPFSEAFNCFIVWSGLVFNKGSAGGFGVRDDYVGQRKYAISENTSFSKKFYLVNTVFST